jgi:hypothetical protein
MTHQGATTYGLIARLTNVSTETGDTVHLLICYEHDGELNDLKVVDVQVEAFEPDGEQKQKMSLEDQRAADRHWRMIHRESKSFQKLCERHAWAHWFKDGQHQKEAA